MKRIWIKEEIEKAVKESNNLRQCLLILGIDPRSSSRNTLKNKIKEFNIDTSHFIKRKYNLTFNGETQICSCCKKEKPKEEFYTRSRNKSNIQSICKECNKKKYNKNRNEKALKEKYDLLLLKGGKCSNCGLEVTLDNTVVFDFHHLDENTKTFSITTSRNTKKEDLYTEIEKCTILCANCHRLYHHNKRKEKYE